MPSGGARARSGPAPDPNALRRDRDQAGWVTLPTEGLPKAPEWPLVDPSDRELGIWKALWTERPQAHMWLQLHLADEVALYVRWLVQAESPEASAAILTIVRQLAESLGISVPGMHRNKWKIAGAGEAAGKAARATAPARRRTPSSRDRLKVVPPTSGE